MRLRIFKEETTTEDNAIVIDVVAKNVWGWLNTADFSTRLEKSYGVTKDESICIAAMVRDEKFHRIERWVPGKKWVAIAVFGQEKKTVVHEEKKKRRKKMRKKFKVVLTEKEILAKKIEKLRLENERLKKGPRRRREPDLYLEDIVAMGMF